MSLTSALNTAKSSLGAIQTQTALVSRNIANVNTEGASRKYANVVTGIDGRVEVRSVNQMSDPVLFRNMLDSNADLNRSSAVSDGLTRINEMIGDIQNGQTPAALVGALSDKLKAYAASPNSIDFANAAASAAQDMADALNQGTQTIDTIRRDADNELSAAADDMNQILSQIEDVNKQVIAGTAANRDITDLQDQRDQLVAKLSQYVGVTAQTRGNNDLVLYTDSGVPMFDKVARTVSFSTTHPLLDGQPGNGFKIDGTLVTGDNSIMPVKTGRVAGLVELRDKVAVTYQTQLDEVARGLIAATSERPATASDVPGLFTVSDPTTLATTSTVGVGTFDAAKLTAGDTLSFDFQLGNTTYKFSGTVPALAPATAAADFSTWLQTQLANTTPSGGTGTLGANHVSVAIGAGNAINLTANGVGGKLAIGVSNIKSTTAGQSGGIVETAPSVSNTAVFGLARQIKVADAVLADPYAIRDGVSQNFNNPGGTKLGGYTDRINSLTAALGATQSYAATGAKTGGSLVDFAASSTSWLQQQRSQASSAVDYRQTLLDRTKETLSNATGVNLDTESLKMLDLERSYQASSKVLTTVNEMLKTLMEMV